jgi:hypothetical protein
MTAQSREIDLMRQYAWLAVLSIGIFALPSLARGETLTLNYGGRTSRPEGHATCRVNVTVEDGDGAALRFRLEPAPVNPLTGENGGEIRLKTPVTASAGHEDACDTWRDDKPAAQLAIVGDLATHEVVFQLHSHPDDNCQASGNAKGKIRMTVDTPGAAITAGPAVCDSNQRRGNLRKRARHRKRIKTGAPAEITVEVVNEGPGPSKGATLTMILPEQSAWIVSATAAGQPCTIGRIAGTPAKPQHNIVCDLGDLEHDESRLVDVVFVPRRLGPFDTTLAVGADNNGELFDPNSTERTDVSQGATRTLALTVKGRNGGGGTVNVNPAGGNTPADCTHPDPANAANKKTQCIHFYNPNTAVTLTATPQAGSTVTWSGACTGNAATCSLTMDSDKSVDAKFAP